MKYLLLAISLCFGLTKNITSKIGGKDFVGVKGLFRVNIITSICAVAVFSMFSIGKATTVSAPFILLAIAYGLLTLGSQSFYILALKGYSLSVCSLIYALNFLTPTLYGIIFNREYPSVYKIIGIILIVIAVLLISSSKKESKVKDKRPIYLLFAFLSMLCSGLVGVIQKIYGRNFTAESLDLFLLIGFALVLTSLLIALPLARKMTGNFRIFTKKLGGKFYITAILLSVSVIVANKLNTNLASSLPSFIFFPILNGGTVIFSMLLSVVIFKEKITKSLVFSALLGASGIVLVAF